MGTAWPYRHQRPGRTRDFNIKGERKFITIYANPSAPDATRSGAVWQLRDRVVAASADCGFYVSVRGFTAEAQQFADTAPIQLIDGSRGEKAPCWMMVPTRNV